MFRRILLVQGGSASFPAWNRRTNRRPCGTATLTRLIHTGNLIRHLAYLPSWLRSILIPSPPSWTSNPSSWENMYLLFWASRVPIQPFILGGQFTSLHTPLSSWTPCLFSRKFSLHVLFLVLLLSAVLGVLSFCRMSAICSFKVPSINFEWDSLHYIRGGRSANEFR